MRDSLLRSSRLVFRSLRVTSLLLAALVLFSILWPAVSPYDPDGVDFSEAREGPSFAHPLGTDLFGRDLLTRLAVGGRVTILIAVAAAALIAAAGVTYGSIAGALGGPVDGLLMRVVDVLFATPRFPVIVFVLAAFPTSTNLRTVIIALSILGWMGTARLVRGELVRVKASRFVAAAHSIGARRRRIFTRHLFPNSLGLVAVGVFLELPLVILGEAFVSVLNLGLNPPQASWGTLAADGLARHRLLEVAWPSIAIAVFALGTGAIADALQRAADPRRADAAEPRP
jgi:oligopeptide transport system permease protein